MIAILLFSGIAALLVCLAGLRDPAKDPRLSLLVLWLLVIYPLTIFLPKVALLPVVSEVELNAGAHWRNWILGVWLAGFLIALVRMVLACKGLSNWWKRSVPIGREGEVEIRRLSGLKSPMAAGVVRPVVFVPECWEVWSDEIRRMVLKHELAHHRRRDPLWRWIGQIACAIHGCNPLVIWISRRFTLQSEYACDAMVLNDGTCPGDYARLLCDLAEDVPPHRVGLAMAAASTLEVRVRRMMHPQGNQGSAWGFVLVVIAVTCAGGLAILGPKSVTNGAGEVELRWSANPFPGEK